MATPEFMGLIAPIQVSLATCQQIAEEEALGRPSRGAGLADVIVGPQVYLLVFDAAPQPFDEYVWSDPWHSDWHPHVAQNATATTGVLIETARIDRRWKLGHEAVEI
jgi:hypothetical protein